MKEKIIICAFGTLGRMCIESLMEQGYLIEYIFTHRDEDCGSVANLAEKYDIKYSYTAPRFNDLLEYTKVFDSIKANYLISINYRYILPKEILDLVEYPINLHGSLLPKYRGRTPHVWSIINGEKTTGVTAHIMEPGVDTGDIIIQESIDIQQEDTGYTLLKKYEKVYPSILIKALEIIKKGDALQKQNEQEASYFGKRTPEMGYIDFHKSHIDVINFIRAQAEPYPGAYYYLLDGRKIIINKVKIEPLINFVQAVGVIREIGSHYYVRCNDVVLKLLEYRIINK